MWLMRVIIITLFLSLFASFSAADTSLFTGDGFSNGLAIPCRPFYEVIFNRTFWSMNGRGLWGVSGGEIGVLMPDHAFYSSYTLGTRCTGLFLNVTYPVNYDVFFFPQISPNVTYDVSGAHIPTCKYRLNVNGLWYSWNNLTCINGLNSKIITLPAGENTTLEFMLSDGSCVVRDDVYVSVYYYSYKNGTPLKNLWILVLLLIYVLYDLLFDNGI